MPLKKLRPGGWRRDEGWRHGRQWNKSTDREQANLTRVSGASEHVQSRLKIWKGISMPPPIQNFWSLLLPSKTARV